MGFYKKEYENEIVFVINNKTVDDNIVTDIFCHIDCDKKIGFDLKNVENINSPLFIKKLLQGDFKLFNLKSEVLAYLALILKDGFLKSHINYFDFKENKRELIRRKLFVA